MIDLRLVSCEVEVKMRAVSFLGNLPVPLAPTASSLPALHPGVPSPSPLSQLPFWPLPSRLTSTKSLPKLRKIASHNEPEREPEESFQQGDDDRHGEEELTHTSATGVGITQHHHKDSRNHLDGKANHEESEPVKVVQLGDEQHGIEKPATFGRLLKYG